MKRRKNNKKFIIVLLLLIVGGVIGYAALRTNLTINGQTTVAKNTWSVKFTTITPVKNDGTITSTPTVTGDTTFSFGVKLNTPGDEYKVKVKVENQGTIDAMVSGNPTLSGLSDMDDYLDYSVTYADGIAVEAGNLLAANSEDEIIVTLKFKNDISAADLADLATADVTKTMTFSMTYAQADNTAIARQRLVSLPNGRTKDNLQVGDEICVNGTTTECFNFIKYDGTNDEDIVMLAKWNLNVGLRSKGTATNLQDSDVKGGSGYGSVAFSATNYWMDGSSLKSKYGSSYPADVYDIDYVTEPILIDCDYFIDNEDDYEECVNTLNYNTSGYSIAYYVEEYKDKLEGYGASIKDARLLTYSEATDNSIGCNATNYSCPTTGDSAFIINTSFWLGSVVDQEYVLSIKDNGKLAQTWYPSGFGVGVRPVVVISKSSI